MLVILKLSTKCRRTWSWLTTSAPRGIAKPWLRRRKTIHEIFKFFFFPSPLPQSNSWRKKMMVYPVLYFQSKSFKKKHETGGSWQINLLRWLSSISEGNLEEHDLPNARCVLRAGESLDLGDLSLSSYISGSNRVSCPSVKNIRECSLSSVLHSGVVYYLHNQR